MVTEFLWNAASFIVALGVLVTIHEYGHFWVARKLGIKVLRFSVGFGKSLWSRTAKDGTEYVIAAIPLGGYVKMLDEREGDVADNEKHLAFNRQPVLARIAVVLAGPIANFLLAFVVYWWMFVIGIPALKPYLGEIPEQSIAAEAGIESFDEIVSIDGNEVSSREEVNLAVVSRLGESSEMVLNVRHQGESMIREYTLQLEGWSVDPKYPNVLGSLGLVFWSPTYPAVLGEVIPDNPAANAGLKTDDQIISIDGQAVNSWSEMVNIIASQPDKNMHFVIVRDNNQLALDVMLGNRESAGVKQGFLGVGISELPEQQSKLMDNMHYVHQYGVIEAIGHGLDKTAEITLLTFGFIGKLFSGEVSPQNLSGPITIAQGAGAFASYGLAFFLSFLGMISVNLGIINLLPIPVLDGGHLMYYLIELVRGKPLSEQIQEIGYRVGLVLVMSLMVFSIVNDIGRL